MISRFIDYFFIVGIYFDRTGPASSSRAIPKYFLMTLLFIATAAGPPESIVINT